MSWILTHFWLIFGYLLGFLCSLALLRQPRHRQGIGLWLLGMLLIPYLAVPLYLAFGGRKYRKIIQEKGGIEFGEAASEASDDDDPIDRMLRNFGLPSSSGGNSVTIWDNGIDTYNGLMDQIRNARRSISIETYVLHLDATGQAVVDALTERAREGLDVRLLIDAVGSMPVKKKHLEEFVKAGGHLAYFIPVLHLPFRGKTNTRNHRKIAIFDCEHVIAGGSNIAEEYIGPTPLEGRWKDINFLLKGPSVQHYLAIFRSDWSFASREALPEDAWSWKGTTEIPGGKDVTQVIPSGPDIPRDTLYDSILTAIYGARKRLWIAAPYFVPDDALCEAICLAVSRGVDVRVIIPDVSNQPLADLARSTYLRQIHEAGGRIFRYRGCNFHGKTVLVDDRLGFVGSMNMDRRSLFINFEVMLLMYGPELLEHVARWNETLIDGSDEHVPTRSRIRLLQEGIVRILVPLL